MDCAAAVASAIEIVVTVRWIDASRGCIWGRLVALTTAPVKGSCETIGRIIEVRVVGG